MIYYDAKKRVTAYDGRETAPAGARADMFLGTDGKPLPFSTGVLTGRSTGVPGAIAMRWPWRSMDHGKLALAQACSPMPSAWLPTASSSARAWPA